MSGINVKDFIKKETEIADRIVSVNLKQAKEIFGTNAKNPDRWHIELYLESGTTVRLPLPHGLDFQENRWIVTNPHRLRRSLQNEFSKLRRFIERYGDLPIAGMEIKTIIDAKGFPQVAL